jgi:hypothetical protein
MVTLLGRWKGGVELYVVLDTHAEALRRLLPVLVGERGQALLRECHGR